MGGSLDDDRARWLASRRRTVVETYDAEAATYDRDEYPTETQAAWVGRLVAELEPGSVLLDAPCGTGRYFPVAAAAGVRVVGIDQSAGMLARARSRGIAERLERVSLQSLSYDAAFDGSMTVDAMENVPPEDWPVVLGNLRRAVAPGSPMYLTVEEIDDDEIDAAFEKARRAGWPAVRGEVVEGDTAGYHYYPGRERVLGWLAAASLGVEDETLTRHDGWAYLHLLLRRRS
jgi:cyclopropane fatty-acyl-phospholipid synthase-like methyltransferase